MIASVPKLVFVILSALALPADAAPISTKRGDNTGIPGWQPLYGIGPVVPSPKLNEPGIPGWQPIYGIGPIIPSSGPKRPAKRDGEDAGIPGWQSIYGHGPVVPSKPVESGEPGIPGWQPIYGHGPVIPSKPKEHDHEASAPTSTRSSKYAIDYLPTWAISAATPTQTNAGEIHPTSTKSSKYAIDYLPAWAILAPKETRHSAL